MIKSIIKSLSELKKPCEPVQEGEDIQSLIDDLRDTLATVSGYALAANQIGILKQVAYCYINGEEFILVNPVIVDKQEPITFPESCLSFPGITVNTRRYNNITLVNSGEIINCSGIKAVVIQHEISHLQGRTLFDYKAKAR
jgi:peptide deformylase